MHSSRLDGSARKIHARTRKIGLRSASLPMQPSVTSYFAATWEQKVLVFWPLITSYSTCDARASSTRRPAVQFGGKLLLLLLPRCPMAVMLRRSRGAVVHCERVSETWSPQHPPNMAGVRSGHPTVLTHHRSHPRVDCRITCDSIRRIAALSDVAYLLLPRHVPMYVVYYANTMCSATWVEGCAYDSRLCTYIICRSALFMSIPWI